MKTTYFILIAVSLIIGCSSYQSNSSQPEDVKTESDTLRIANDSLDYEIIIIEPGFQAWLATQPARGYFTQSAMEIVNRFKVNEYNLRINNPQLYDPNLYVWRIDYDRNIDYGYEVNYLLYNWFLFFEQRYNQQLQ